MDDAITINLDDLKEIMDDLDSHASANPAERRKHSLTRDDVLIIARIIQATSGQTCSMGLEEGEISTLKKFVSVVNRGAWAIGWLVVSTLVVGVMSILGMGIKYGIHEIATKGVK